MKVNKILLIIQLSLMYLSELLIALGALMPTNDNEAMKNAMTALFITGIVISCLTILLSFVILVPSFISIFKKNNVDMTLFTMIIKIVAIPWYIVNFILCALVIAGMLNPFLMIIIPLMVFFFVSVTYLDMLSSSVNNVAVIISEFKNKTLKPNPLLIIGMVFQFMFCLDVLGAIFTYVNKKKQKSRG